MPDVYKRQVYAVHNDKKHMHGHIVFNSVSFETGMKHECKKGEWKQDVYKRQVWQKRNFRNKVP